MSHESIRRSASIPVATPGNIPRAPPLPAPRPFQRARDAANRIFGYPSRPASPQERRADTVLGGVSRFALLGAAQNATATHRTGLEIKTLSINESGTHALIGGKDILKTVKVENGVCVEDVNLRAAIRSTPTQASGKPRQIYNIDIADVAWAKGDCGEYVAAATESGKIILYDLGHAGLPAAQLHEHYRQVHRITFNPHSGSLLLSGSQDGTVRLWDVRDARKHAGGTATSTSTASSNLQSKSRFADTSDSVRDVKWSPTDGVDFAFATDGGYAQVWDMRNLKQPKVKIVAHNLTCTSVDWHPDGKHLASAGLDKMIKVWDVTTKPGRKPGWEIKTPFPVTNARWRPPCESTMSDDDSARQCSQLLAAYDREHPLLHVWDLRRTAIPFRVMTPHSEAPTDLLWHSQDLLWTVGRDGSFLQSDIQHNSRKTMDEFSVNTLDISSTGEIASFNMKRTTRRSPKRQPVAVTTISSGDLGQNPEQSHISRSWADDSLDNVFLSAHPESHRERSARRHRNSSVSATPPQSGRSRVVNLDHVFVHRRPHRPQQIAWRGQLPEPFAHDPLKFEYMAQQSQLRFKPLSANVDIKDHIEQVFAYNRQIAINAQSYGVSKQWDICGFITINHIRRRETAFAKLQSSGYSFPATPDRYTAGALSAMSKRLMSAATEEGLLPEGARADSPAVPEHAFAAPIASLASHAHIEAEIEAPFKLGRMLQHLLDVTFTQEHASAQSAAHLILVLGPCLPTTRPLSVEKAEACVAVYNNAFANVGYDAEEIPRLVESCFSHIVRAGLNPLQVESILSAYHDQLVAHRNWNEAAQLRLLAYPAFPAVYEQALAANTSVALMCGCCSAPIVSGREKLKCETCGAKQAACPVCELKESPFTESPLGVRLWSQCLICNHGGHAACLRMVFVEEKMGGCPTRGCLCDCTEGLWREEKERLAEVEAPPVVRRDGVVAKESGAVAALRR